MKKYARLTGLALAATTGLACSELNAPLYFKGDTIVAMGMDDPLPVGGVTLRFRQPTAVEQMQLDAQRAALAAATPGYDAEIPWVSRDKVHIEVSYKVTNTSNQAASFTVIVDGADQYTKYDTQVVAAALQQGNNNAPTFLPLIPVIPPKDMLPPGGSFSGIVREDDFSEGELDLDALGRWLDSPGMTTVPNFGPTFAGVLINRSEVAPYIGMGKVPGYVAVCPPPLQTCDDSQKILARQNPGLLVVPAMVEIDLRLKTDVPMQVEYFVRVRDDDDRLWHNDADPMLQTNPTLFQPTIM
jgi:hypothetical protein